MRTVNFQLMLPGPAVKKLIMIHVGIWAILQMLIDPVIFGGSFFIDYGGLVPNDIISHFYLWQFVTYMFLHSTNPFHILFNMLSLWFFGSELEMRWGTRLFITYYVFCGVGAGLIYMLGISVWAVVHGVPAGVFTSPVVGASGAIFGILLAYGVLFGDRIVYFWFAFPIKARYFMMIIAGIEVFTLISNGLGSGIANLAHLGGLVSGALFLFGWTRLQQLKWRKGSATRRNLKLVVNKDDSENGPRYWN